MKRKLQLGEDVSHIAGKTLCPIYVTLRIMKHVWNNGCIHVSFISLVASIGNLPMRSDKVQPTAIVVRHMMTDCRIFNTKELNVWTAMAIVKKPVAKFPTCIKVAGI